MIPDCSAALLIIRDPGVPIFLFHYPQCAGEDHITVVITSLPNNVKITTLSIKLSSHISLYQK